MARLARIVVGGRSPEYGATVYRLRAGAQGTGRILHEHRALGAQAAHDTAIAACRLAADRLGRSIEPDDFVRLGRYEHPGWL